LKPVKTKNPLTDRLSPCCHGTKQLHTAYCIPYLLHTAYRIRIR